MADLRKRFGQLVAVHRRRKGLTQEALAEAADLSVDMVSKIEVGATGTRFPVIERLAAALDVDPAEFFTTEIASGAVKRKTLNEISVRLSRLSDSDLDWASRLLDAALRPRIGGSTMAEAAAAFGSVETPRKRRVGRKRL